MTRNGANGPGPRTPGGALEPFRQPTFAFCWLTGLLGQAAHWMLNIAVPYLVFQMTGSASWLGAAAIAGQAPALLGSPIGGVLADRYSRRGLLLGTLAVKSFVAYALYRLWTADSLDLLVIMALLVANGLAGTAHITGWSSFVATIVPRSAFAAAYRLNSIQVNLSRAAGPALAGWVLAHHGPETAFLLAALLYLPFVVALLSARPRPVPVQVDEGPLRALRAGADAIVRDRRLAAPILTVAVVSFFGGGLQPLIAGIAADVYGLGAQGFGWLVSSMGISCVATGAAIALIGDRIRRSAMAGFGVAVFAAGALLCVATNRYEIGLAALAVIGIGHTCVYVSCAIALQLRLDETLRGRVTSLYMTGIFVCMPVGAQLAGFFADRVGLAPVVSSYGTALAGFALIAGLWPGGFRHLDDE